MNNDFDKIEEIFKSKLQNFEANPPANAWITIQSQIGTPATPAGNTGLAAKGLSAVAKLVIAASVVAGAVTGGYIWLNQTPAQQTAVESNSETVEISSSGSNLSETPADISAQQENDTEKTTPVLASETEGKGTVEQDNYQEKEIESQEEVPVSPAEQPVYTPETEVESTSNNMAEISTPASPLATTGTSTEPEQSERIAGEETTGINAIADVEEKTEQTPAEDAVNTTADEEQTSLPETVILPIPNVITPNHDGVNDIIKIQVENYAGFQAQVFDLSGNLIFEWNTPDGFWDGNDFSGNSVPKGNYAVIVTVKTPQGNIVQKKSIITLYK